MQLKLIQLEEIWPPDLELAGLRLFLREQLMKYGKPLRWSLTAIEEEGAHSTLRRIRIEAVVITSDQI